MDPIFLIEALLYACGFWVISWRYPAVALALVFGTAPFQNDLSGGLGVKFSFAEINLLLATPLFLAMLLSGQRRLRMWPLFWPCVLFSLACVASSLVKWHSGSALTSYVQQGLFFFVVVPIFALMARRAEDLKPALWALLGISSIVALTAVITRKEYVLGLHKNGIGGSLACALIVAVELWFHLQAQQETDDTRRSLGWQKRLLGVLIALFSLGLLFSLSRGGWLAAASGLILISSMRRQWVLLARAAVLIIPFLFVAWSLLPQESKDYATSFDAKRGNIKARYNNSDRTLAQWRSSPTFGAGMGLRKEIDATNFVLMALAETGVVGFVTFMGLFAAFAVMVSRGQKEMARDDFAYSLLAIGGALMLSRLMHGMVDHYWARGPTMMAWASAGMATGALWFARERVLASKTPRARALLALHLLETRRREGLPLFPPSPISAEFGVRSAELGSSEVSHSSLRTLRSSDKLTALERMARDGDDA